MPVQITVNLKATPNPATLPKRITLTQSLRSMLEQEVVTVEYSLDAGHNVFFKDGDAAPSKTFVRKETLGRTEKVCADRVSLIEQAGAAMDLVQVNQIITDSVGLTCTDLTLVQIRR